jgi:metal-sulfur cluster biosynthetic enzyme
MSEADVWQVLAQVADPELPVSIVDLGLVYAVRMTDGRVEVDLTLTSMGCPCTDWITEDIEERVARLPGVSEVHVALVWDPPWTLERISGAARAALASAGINA